MDLGNQLQTTLGTAYTLERELGGGMSRVFVAEALAYAGNRGIVHRDIKRPDALLPGRSATVTDFGIARAVSASRTRPDYHGLAGVPDSAIAEFRPPTFAIR